MRLRQVITDYIRRSILTTRGDLVVRGAAQPERLASGALDTYLRGKGAGVIPAYEAEPTRPAMRVTLSADQPLLNGVITTLHMDTIIFDTTDNFNTTTHRWTCGSAGLYLISIGARLLNSTDGRVFYLRMRLNDTSYPFITFLIASTTAASFAITMADMLVLSVGDFLEFQGQHQM